VGAGRGVGGGGGWEVQAQGLRDDLLGFKDGVFPGVLLLSRRR